MKINQRRIIKTLTRPLNTTVKANNNKNITFNTVSEIQTSDSDQDTEIDENDSNLMGWNNLPDMVLTSDSSDMSDIDGPT